MNKLPRVQQEAEEIEKKIGYYIPPYKMNELMKLASKVTSVITASSPITVSYTDCMIVLDIVQSTIKRIKGGGNDAT